MIYRRVVATGSETAAAHAAGMLGRLLETRGDLPAARAAYERAASADLFDVSPRAWLTLGLLRQRSGPSQASDDALAIAAESGRPEIAAEAAFRLGGRLLAAGDGTQASPWLELATYSNDAATGAKAAIGLGVVLLSARNDAARAEIVLRRALASADPETVQVARSLLEGER